MERGELDGRCGTHLTSFKALHPGWFAERKIRVPVIIAERRRADLPDTPAVMEFVRDELIRAQLELMMVVQNMDRPGWRPRAFPPSVSRSCVRRSTPPWPTPHFAPRSTSAAFTSIRCVART
jgi:hypothetical protein